MLLLAAENKGLLAVIKKLSMLKFPMQDVIAHVYLGHDI
jgi:hypothetical protein